MDANPSDAEEGRLSQQTCAALAQPDTPARRRGIALLFLASFALFVLFAMDFRLLPIVVGVVFLHEAGHYLAMRVFGYRDLRIFFISFFGRRRLWPQARRTGLATSDRTHVGAAFRDCPGRNSL